jgi:hypothetical protein
VTFSNLLQLLLNHGKKKHEIQNDIQCIKKGLFGFYFCFTNQCFHIFSSIYASYKKEALLLHKTNYRALSRRGLNQTYIWCFFAGEQCYKDLNNLHQQLQYINSNLTAIYCSSFRFLFIFLFNSISWALVTLRDTIKFHNL